MNAILVDKLTKVFPGGIVAVDSVDFDVRVGEIFGFLGPNGAGKTTTIKMLNTLIRPTSGTAIISGYDIRKNAAGVRRRIGYVGQNVGVDEYATAWENLVLYGHFYRLDRSTLKQRMNELLDLVDLAGHEHRMVSTYSGGMRKRLDIAMGLIHWPDVVFLDEPTVGLDPQTRAHIWDYIRALARFLNVTIFLTTHYMDEADQLSDRIAIIDNGKIIAVGTPDELKKSISGDVVILSPCSAREEDCQGFIEKSRQSLADRSYVVAMQAMERDLAVYVTEGETALPDIVRRLNQDGIEVRTIAFSRPSLDDVFLRYTGKIIRDQEGVPTTYADIQRRRNKRKS